MKKTNKNVICKMLHKTTCVPVVEQEEVCEELESKIAKMTAKASTLSMIIFFVI